MKMISLIAFVFFCSFNVSAQKNSDTTLIASYPFNGNAEDESDYLNHGTVVGATLTTDRFGADSSAYEFNGTSAYISVAHSASLQSPANELTQVAWINIYSWSMVGSAFGPVLMKSNSGGNAFQYRLSVSSSGINTAINNWENAVTIFDTLNFDTWYMVASTLKDDTIRVFLDGEFIGEGKLTGPINPDDKPLEIGRDVPGATECFHGKIDDIRIYNRALSDDEIYILFEGSLGFSPDTKLTNPNELILYQNHPNPFNTITKISWQSQLGCHQTLKIYNIFGKEMATLVNEYKPAGKHEIEFFAAKLSGGIYFIELRADKFISTKKIILLK